MSNAAEETVQTTADEPRYDQRMVRGKTAAQREVLRRISEGHTLAWYGDNGPSICGENWPQKRTVRAMLRAGLLRWEEYRNEAQRECGIQFLSANEKSTCEGKSNE